MSYDQKSKTWTRNIISKMIRATPGLQSFILYVLNAFCLLIKGPKSLSQVDEGSVFIFTVIVDMAKNHISEGYGNN